MNEKASVDITEHAGWIDASYFRHFSVAFAVMLASEFLQHQLGGRLGSEPVVWIMPGVGIAFLWHLGNRLWPAMLIACFLGMVLSGMPALEALLKAGALSASVLLASLLLRLPVMFGEKDFTDHQLLRRKPLAIGAAALAGSLAYALILGLAEIWSRTTTIKAVLPDLITPSVGFLTGMLTIGSLLLLYARGDFGAALDRIRQPVSMMLFLSLTALVGISLQLEDAWLLCLLPVMPGVIMAARRIGIWGAFAWLSMAILVCSVLAAGSVVLFNQQDSAMILLSLAAACLAIALLAGVEQHPQYLNTIEQMPAGHSGILKLLSEIPSIATMGTDHQGRIIFWSAACAKMYGFSAEQVAGRALDSILLTRTDFEHSPQPSPLAHPSSAESQPPAERIVETADGLQVPVFSSQITLLNADGDPEYFRIDIDLTELRMLESQRRDLDARIQDSQRLESLGLMAGGVAHDFNNMLQAIIGNADLAMMDVPPGNEARHRLRDVLQTSEQAQELCQQMLAFSGRGKFVVRDIDLSATINETTPLLQVSLQRSARLHLDLSDELPLVKADSSQVRQLIVNLISNASDSLPEEGGDIRVATYPEILSRPTLRRMNLADRMLPGLYVCFEVVDNGCGMDEVTRKQIFDPFFTTKFTGRGLGLAAALGIVRGHSGAITVDTDVGKGSRFRIWLPASTAVPDAEKDIERPIKPLDVQSRRLTVLIADDEPAVLSSVERILRSADYRILTATGGRSAIEILRTHAQTIDLALIDLTMPGMDGIEVISEIRRFDQRLPVILTSGFSQEDVVKHFTTSGPTWFVQKPFRAKHLLDMLNEILRDDAPSGSE